MSETYSELQGRVVQQPPSTISYNEQDNTYAYTIGYLPDILTYYSSITVQYETVDDINNSHSYSYTYFRWPDNIFSYACFEYPLTTYSYERFEQPLTTYAYSKFEEPLSTYSYVRFEQPLTTYSYEHFEFPITAYSYERFEYPLTTYSYERFEYPLTAYSYERFEYPLTTYSYERFEYPLTAYTYFDRNSYIWHKNYLVTYTYVHQTPTPEEFQRETAKELYVASLFVTTYGVELNPDNIARKAIYRAQVLWNNMPSSWRHI